MSGPSTYANYAHSYMPGQIISGGVYFAILRLIHHAKMGKVLSKDLVFLPIHLSAERPDARPQEPTASTPHDPQQNSEPSLCREPANSEVATAVPTHTLVNPLEEVSNPNPNPPRDPQSGPSTRAPAEATKTAEILKSDEPQLEERTHRRASDVLKELNNPFSSLRGFQNTLQNGAFKVNTSEAEKLHQIVTLVVSQSHKEVRAVVKRLGKTQPVEAEKKAIDDADALLTANYDIWNMLIARVRDLFYRERAARYEEKHRKKALALALMLLDSSKDPSVQQEITSSLEITAGSNMGPGCDSPADAENGPEPDGDASAPIQTLSQISEAVAGEKRKHQEIAEEASIKSEADDEKELPVKKIKKSELA